MARAPKPIALQTGNLIKEEVEKREEQEKKLKGNNNKVYKAPKGMSNEVKRIYKTLVDELKSADILNNLDIELLITTSHAIYRMRQAREQLDKNGIVVTGARGTQVKSPYVQVEETYQKIFHTGCLQLGLSPSSRAKLAMMAAESESEDDDF